VKTDLYYLKLCNEVKQAILENKNAFLLFTIINEDDVILLSCFLASYFEDLVSETNVWNSFVRLHKQQYGKQLPFFDLSDYVEEEINIQDVCFLIWYFIADLDNEKIVSPTSEFICELAEDIFNVFDKEWEAAPENQDLKSFYEIAEDEHDLYEARKLIDVILFETYLFSIDTAYLLKQKEIEIVEKYDNDNDVLLYLHESRDKIIFNASTRLLGLKGKDWASEILPVSHPIKKIYADISKKISGLFFYKGQDDEYITIEHIATGEMFKFTKKSFDYEDELREIDSIVYLGIVKWDGEWWFSGLFSFIESSKEKIIRSEKQSVASLSAVAFLYCEDEKVNEILDLQYNAFLEFNSGSQIAFLSSEQVNVFIDKFTEYYNASIHKKGKVSKWKNMLLETNDSDLVFFNPKSGLEIVTSLNSSFPMPNNPYCKEKNITEDFMFLILSNEISAELVYFCIDNCKDRIYYLHSEEGKAVFDNIDFILRFYKKEHYFAEPAVTAF